MSSEKLTRAVGRRLVALPIGTQRAGSRIHTYRPARRISLLREPFKPVAGACNSMPKPTFSADRKEPHPLDNPQNAKLLACGYYDSGVRVFDIHDPLRPREIAYYKPPAPGKAPVRPGSWWAAGIAPGYRSPQERRADAVPFVAAFRPGGEIWFISHEGGFQIVRFTDWIKNTEKALFSGLQSRL